MIKQLQGAAAVCLIVAAGASAAAPAIVTPHIHVDQFGYLPAMRKLAVIADPQLGFNAAESFNPGTGTNQYQLRRWGDDSVVMSGTLQAWNGGATHAQSGDRGWRFDFSSVTSPGSYYIYDTVRSAGSGRFEIGDGAYDAALRAAMRVFFYQRIGSAKAPPFADARWTEGVSYEGPNQDTQARSRWAKTDASTARDLRGGWMDAGDTNKYTTFAHEAVVPLLNAYRSNPAVFSDNFGIPESGNGISDLLDEVKWELDFLKRMQDATGTGGFVLKLGVDTFTGLASPPSSDTRPRYYVPECTSATLAGASMFAAAGMVYRSVTPLASYGNDLLARAESAWVRAKTTTSNFSSYETNCDDLDVKSGDADRTAADQIGLALLAAIGLYEATGKSEYADFVAARHLQTEPMSNGWWGPYNTALQAGLLRHAAQPGVSSAVASAIRNQKTAQTVFSIQDLAADRDLYRAYMADDQHHWGSNGVRGWIGSLNLDFVEYNINTPQAAAYREVAEQHLHWLHGANPLRKVMLSNMGPEGAESSVDEFYHAWFDNGTVYDNVQTSPVGPAPGYVVGGPNKNYTGTVAGITDQPVQKAYKEWNTSWPENSWELTEPSIYGQAAYLQLLARVMTRAPVSNDTQPPTTPTNLVAGNVTATSATLSWTASIDNVGVTGYDVFRNTARIATNAAGTSFAMSGLVCGTRYDLAVAARDAAGNVSPTSAPLAVTTNACSGGGDALIYDEALDASWSDWSWGSTRNFADATRARSGTVSIRVDYQGWGGLSLAGAQPVPVTSTSRLRMWLYSPTAVSLQVSAQADTASPPPANVTVALRANRWTAVALSPAQLGNLNRIQRINVQLNGAGAATVNVDQVRVTAR